MNLLIHREDFDKVITVLVEARFTYEAINGRHVFLDRPDSKPRDAVFVFFANEKVREEDFEPTADVSESVIGEDAKYRCLSLDALVRMKLTSFRNKDAMHLRDLADVGLIDETWPARYPAVLADRLQHVLDTPDG